MTHPIHRTSAGVSYERIFQASDLQMRTHLVALGVLISFSVIFGCPWEIAIPLSIGLLGSLCLSTCPRSFVRETAYLSPARTVTVPWPQNRCVHVAPPPIFEIPQRAPVATRERTPLRRMGSPAALSPLPFRAGVGTRAVQPPVFRAPPPAAPHPFQEQRATVGNRR